MKRRIAFLIVLFCCITGLAHADDWEQGQALLNDGRYPEALEVFNALWSTQGQDRSGITPYIEICKKMISAQSMYEETKYAEALQLTEEVAVVMPKNEKIQSLLSQRRRIIDLKDRVDTLYENGDHEALLKTYQEMLDLNPKDERSARAVNAYRQFSWQLDKAHAAFRTGEWDTSLGLLKKAWTLLPSSPQLQEDISINMTALAAKDAFTEGRYDEAIGSFKRLFQAYPTYDIFREYTDKSYRLQRLSIEARVLFTESALDKAYRTAQDMLALNPSDPVAQEITTNILKVRKVLAEGDALLLKRSYTEAHKVYAEGYKALPSVADIRERLTLTAAILNGQAKRTPAFSDNALAHFTTYKDLSLYVRSVASTETRAPTDPALARQITELRNAGMAAFFDTNYTEALEKFNAILQIDARDQQIRSFRERTQKAMGYRKEIQKLNEIGETEEAKKTYQKLLIVNPQEKDLSQIK